jgi:Pyruvate/2-oxoacid:ferredoxin oxidoreductase delta subunit
LAQRSEKTTQKVRNYDYCKGLGNFGKRNYFG